MASVNQSSVWEVTSQTDETPCDDTVMDWLHTLQRDQLEMAANLLFRHLAMTILDPDRSRIVSIDFVDNPYHGSPNEDSGELCKTTPTDGTTTCHRYCTAYVVSNGKPVTLALTYVRSDEKEADAVERVLDRVGAYRFNIDLLLADRGFYNERVIRRARDLATTVIPVQKKGERMKDKLATDCSYMTSYRMYKGSERELHFPLAVSVSYQNGDRGKHGEIVRGYVACDLRGGRDLPEQFTFQTFCDWIRHELEAELGRRWEIEMNSVVVPDAYASAADWPSARGLGPAIRQQRHSSETASITTLVTVSVSSRSTLQFTQLPLRD